MRRPAQFCDYFIIASGSSTRQVKAITDYIKEKTRQEGQAPYHIEGYEEASWVLMDFHDIVAHIFLNDTRDFYALERLWTDALKLEFDEDKGLMVRECAP